jgi:2-haloacid dehalogenase
MSMSVSTDKAAAPTTLLFDVMGTVVDIDGSVRRLATATLSAAGVDPARIDDVISAWERAHASSMDAVIGGTAPWRGHRDLRRAALEEVWAEGDLPALSSAAVTELTTVIHRLDPWPDSADALSRLRSTCTVVALSNADTAELVDLSAHGGLSWHGLLSAQIVASYKPDPAVYLMAAEHLALDPGDIMMVAAHPWDLRGAAALGFATAYVARPGAERPQADDAFDVEVDDLAALADRFRPTGG